MRVLLVDDDAASRLLRSRILIRDHQCAITEAANGLEGLERLSKGRYDCAIIDLVMPIMDGLEMLAAIRSDPRLAALPVLVVSAVRDADLVRQVIALGIEGYIAKPLRPSIVSGRLRQFVTRMTALPASIAREHDDLPRGARVLVVDGDRNYLHFVRNCLGTDYIVLEADSGAAGLRAMLEGAPALVLLGEHLGALSAPLFMRKVRATPRLEHHRVVLVGSETMRGDLDVDGVMARSFVPEQFRREFQKATTAATPEERWLSERTTLSSQLMSASTQVLGMMLRWEMTAQPAASTLPDRDAHAAEVPIHIEGGPYQPLVQVVAPREACDAMTRAMLGVDEVSDEDAHGTIQEMGNMIAGRMLEALRSQGDTGRLGLPRVFPVEQEPLVHHSALRVALIGGPLTEPLFVGLRQAEQECTTHDA